MPLPDTLTIHSGMNVDPVHVASIFWGTNSITIDAFRDRIETFIQELASQSLVNETWYAYTNFDSFGDRSEVAIDPHWSVSHGELGDVYAAFGEYHDAAKAYDRAVQLGPPYVNHHLTLSADAYEKAGMLEQAINRKLLHAAASPDPAPIVSSIADLATNNGFTIDARAESQKLREVLRPA